MGNNASVRQFKTDMRDLANKAKHNLHTEVLAQAEELADNIRRAIEHSVTGHLAESVRTEDKSNSDETRISVLVRAGGSLTTKHSDAGPFDYASAEEFGTTKEEARPFFYNNVRLYRANGQERFRETFEQTIAANNSLRASRAYNYSDHAGGFSYSSGTAARGGKSNGTLRN
jgi:hypothetical protein